jgi:multidrug efflux pump subunit AcrB
MAEAKKNTSSESKKTIFQRFSLFFFRNTKLSLVLWISIIASGLITYTSLIKREGFPSVQVPISVVNAGYFVEDKQKVDSEVGLPISQAIQQIPEVKEVSTISTNNFTSIVVSYKEGTTSSAGSDLVKSKISQLSLPKDLKLDYQTIDAAKFANEYNMLVSVFPLESAQLDYQTAFASATELATKISTTEGVESAQVIDQRQTALNPQTGQTQQIQKSFDFVAQKDGQNLNFKSSIAIGVLYKEDQDALKQSDRINQTIAAAKSQLGSTKLGAVISSDFAPTVRSQIASLQKNMLEGILIVAIISFALITWRAGLATALAMITVLLTTVLILYLAGITLNVISLFALILSLGLIVDDATIIAEAIYAMRNTSKTRQEMVSIAIKKVARASTAGTLVTIFAFAPMLFISGILGEFIFAIPVTIIVALALSLIVSLSLMPFFAKGFLLGGAHKERENIIQRSEKWVSTKLANLIRFSGKNKKAGAFITLFFIFLSLGSTVVGLGYFSKAGFNIFAPEKDSTELMVRANYRPGSTIQEAEQQARLVNGQVTGAAANFIEEVTYSASGNTQSSTMQIKLSPLDSRTETSVQIADKIQTGLDTLKQQGISASIAAAGAGGPQSDLPLELRIFTTDLESAKKFSEDLQQKLTVAELKTPAGKTFKITKFRAADTSNLLERINSKEYFSLKMGFNVDSSTDLIEAAKAKIQELARPQDFGLKQDSYQINTGQEEDNQDSFKSMMLAFPILLIAMYVLLAVQFRSFLQPLFIFLAIPFSFLGVGMGLYYTHNPASFFVMLGFFALIGIALNNTILITDYAKQEKDAGAGRVNAIASALQARFRPLLTTSITSVVALTPLALSDPFWQSLSVTLIFGLLSSTIMVILCFPYYLIAAEVFRAGGSKVARAVKSKIKR